MSCWHVVPDWFTAFAVSHILMSETLKLTVLTKIRKCRDFVFP
jgi:hypothetical protein